MLLQILYCICLIICFIIDLFVLLKLTLILNNILRLKNSLKQNNCIIIYNKPIRNHIFKIGLILFEYFFDDLIFDINDNYKIIEKLKNKLSDKDCKLNNINVILDTYGGEIMSNDILLNFILDSKIKITSYVIKKSQSAGTLLALISDKLYINSEAILSPTDPQITIDDETYSVKSIIDMCTQKNIDNISDKYLLSYFENKKLHYENIEMMTKLLDKKYRKNISKQKKSEILYEMTSGDYSHHRPLSGIYLNKYLEVYLNIPKSINQLYDIYKYLCYYL
jgi:hypothetical protein